MTFRVRFTEEASADLERLYDFLLQSQAQWPVAEGALETIARGIALLEVSPCDN